MKKDRTPVTGLNSRVNGKDLFRIHIEPTNKCTLNCVMCGDDKSRRAGFMDMELYKKIIDDYHNYEKEGKEIGLWQSGEPLLHPLIVDMVLYAYKKKIRTFLITNGILLKNQLSLKLMEAGLTKITISLGETNRKVYQETKGVDKFDEVITNIRYLLDNKRKGRFKTIVYIQIMNIYGRELSMPEIERDLKSICSQYKGEIFFEIRYRRQWCGLKQIPQACPPPIILYRDKGLCGHLWHYFSILWDGKVVPCCADLNGRGVIANITSSGIKEVWEDKMSFLRNKQLRQENIPLCDLCENYRGVALIKDKIIKFKTVQPEEGVEKLYDYCNYLKSFLELVLNSRSYRLGRNISYVYNALFRVFRKVKGSVRSNISNIIEGKFPNF